MNKFLIWILLTPLCSYSIASTNPNYSEDDIFELSLEELSKIKIKTGSLIGSSTSKSASAITIINKQSIELSGAKNLSHLLEQHVPGMMLMTHSEGEKIGLRGQIAAENYKLLILVNGKNVTNMVYEGAITEIDQWELGDIEQVEVISGPGSVTYGTGAVAGVINIISKSAKNKLPKWSLGLANNSTYQSKGVNLQYSEKIDDWGIYGFISYRETDGLSSPDYYKMNPNEPTDIRFVGKGQSATTPPQEYQADSFGRAQIKAHLDVNYGENFNVWLRYTQSGRTHAFNDKKYKIDEEGNPSDLANFRNIQTRSLIASSDYRFTLTDDSSILTSLTLDSQEYIRYRPENQQLPEDDISNIRQYAFSQDRATLSALYDYKFNDTFNLITGYEYSNIFIGAPWGKDSDHLWIKEGVDIISSIDTSAYLQDLSLDGRPNTENAVEVGKGIRIVTHSHLLESKYTFSPQQELIYAHRYDYSDAADGMFSPRFSLISTLDENSTLVSSIQRGQRMMPLRAQYLNDLAGNNSKHETLDSVELSYSNTSLENTSLNVRGYYNNSNAVGFTGEYLEFLSKTELLGIEFTASYKHKNLELTFNHAFMNPLNIKMNDDLKTGKNRNNISFADYYYNTRRDIPLLLESYGDGLNNWSKNISKFLYTQTFMDQKLKAHISAQVFWDYEGSYDEMRMYQSAYNNFDRNTLSTDEKIAFEEQYQIFLNERQLLEKEDAYEIDYNVNASLTYFWTGNDSTEVQVKLYVENLLNSSNRYYVSTGSNGSLPSRLQYLDKPVMFGLALQVNFK
ncbi:MAG: TonB-dependent receptor plug domain-containing protein [Colwelliaceae bacterium]|nr:TonB-dependent receptor plug domain-containing protein [Colwelliaceae bacterium]